MAVNFMGQRSLLFFTFYHLACMQPCKAMQNAQRMGWNLEERAGCMIQYIRQQLRAWLIRATDETKG